MTAGVPLRQGRGIGRRLLEALWRDLGVQTAEELGVWVLAGNDDARAFYERYPQVSYVLDRPGGVGARITN